MAGSHFNAKMCAVVAYWQSELLLWELNCDQYALMALADVVTD